MLVKFLNIPEVKPSNTPYGNLLSTMVDTKHNPGIKEICMKDPLIKLFAESLLDRFVQWITRDIFIYILIHSRKVEFLYRKLNS